MAYTEHKRPTLFSISAIIGFIFPVLAGMGSMFSPETRRMGDFFPALFGLLVAARFISYVGLWYMKRWGADLFIITFGATLIKDVLMDNLGVISIVYHVAVMIIIGVHYKKMDRNL